MHLWERNLSRRKVDMKERQFFLGRGRGGEPLKGEEKTNKRRGKKKKGVRASKEKYFWRRARKSFKGEGAGRTWSGEKKQSERQALRKFGEGSKQTFSVSKTKKTKRSKGQVRREKIGRKIVSKCRKEERTSEERSRGKSKTRRKKITRRRRRI